MKRYVILFLLCFCSISFAQSTISGTVVDNNNQPVSGANVRVQGESSGSATDASGRFLLNTKKPIPFKIEVTALGFESKKESISADNQELIIKLSGEEVKLDEIVVAASRTPERVMASPVTIERMGIADIKKSAAATFYDGLENMKEVQMNTSSMSFKSVNTRGFASVANTRFMQLVDGMDNSSPLLNFVIGNMIGVSEIDVQSVELLPGASSALYGANAFNGILFMNSKNPFTSKGVTSYVKYGQTSQAAAGNNNFYDVGVRVAHVFNSKFAAKANFTYMEGTDWFATNYSDRATASRTATPGRTRDHYGYDGVNTYGDEVSAVVTAPTLPTDKVSRTGYQERDLTDNKASNTKFDASLHYRPFGNESLEVILQSKFGLGNAVYQGANRYYLNEFFMQQHKLEVKGKNFFVRAYTTTEDGGKSYDMTFTAINMNRLAKADRNWFTDYGNAFANSTLALGYTPNQAHAAARNFADNNVSPNGLTLTPADVVTNGARGTRFAPGSAEFKNAFNQVTAEADATKGSKLVDNSRIYHSDANYNFKDMVKFAEIQVGGSYRVYSLNSSGRIYTDALSTINYNEYGAYTQLTKKAFDDRLKFTGSIRYDKAQNFDGNFSPRVSLVYSAGENKKHNFRASFQTGFRNPTTQDQYIGFNVGSAVLLGSAPDNLARYTENVAVNTAGQAYTAGASTVAITGANAYNNAYTAASAEQFSATGNSALLQKANVSFVKPETVKAFELGYRSAIKGLSVDVSGYYNLYNNFIGNTNVVSVLYGTAQDAPSATLEGQKSIHALANSNTRVFQLYNNANVEVKSLGFGLGLSHKVYKNYLVGVNYNYADFDYDATKDASFRAGFNTPKHRLKMSLGNDKVYKNFGFNVSSRWNSSYLWQSTFGDGVIKAATVIDAQVNYGIPNLKSTIKIGATNIGGPEYVQVYGAGAIGQQYFMSWTINP